MQLKLSFYDWCISILSSKKMSDANHLSGPLRKRKFTSTGPKVYCLWLVDFDPFCELLCFKVRCLWSFCDQNPTLIFQIFLIDVIPTSDFQIDKVKMDEVKILKIQINFWDRKTAIKCRASRAFFPICLLPCTRRSHARHSPRFACLLALLRLSRNACVLHICVNTSPFHYSIWATPK